jgi:hypothetical protein
LKKEDAAAPTLHVSSNSLHAETSLNHPGNMRAPSITTFQKETSASIDSSQLAGLTEGTAVTQE